MARWKLGPTRRRFTLATGVVIVAACGALGWSACGRRSPDPLSDPGNRRLHQMATDPIFHTMPPGAVRDSFQQNPAKYRKTPFQASGWDGPSVILRFSTTESILDVYRYYRDFAANHGWDVDKVSAGIVIQWRKTFPGRSAVTISLLQYGPRTHADSRRWTLSGSSAP